MKESAFSNRQVREVSELLQAYMKSNGRVEMTADECAGILAEHNLLPNSVGPKPGFNFRQMLRDGRNGLIDLVDGASQEREHTRWRIVRTR